MPRVKGRPGESMAAFDFDKLKADLREKHPCASERDVMSAALYPTVTEDFLNFREQFGPVDKLDTRIFLTGPKVGEEFEVCLCTTFINCYNLSVYWFAVHVLKTM